MTPPETPQQEQKNTPHAESKPDLIPAQYKGMPIEVVEKLWQSKVYVDPEKNKAEAERRQQALEAIKKDEADRETAKQRQLSERYSKLPPEQKTEFPTAQTDAGKILNEHIQGTRELDGLSPEESFVLGKLKTAYEEFKKENPDKPFAFDFSRDIDRSVYNNLAQRLAFKVLEGKQRIGDQEKANEIRQDLGVPTQKIQTEGLLVPKQATETSPETEQELTEEKLADYLKLPNVEQAYQSLLKKLGGNFVSAGDLKSDICTMLVTRSSYAETKKHLDQFQQEINTYEKSTTGLQERLKKDGIMDTVVDPRMMGNPGWLHIVTRPEAKGKVKGISKKRYATIPLESPSFVQDIGELAKKLREVAIQNNDAIEIKFPEGFESFAQHNDSVVIHFKNEASEQLINDALQEYLTSKGFREDERELGRTKIAADSKDTSFSDLVALNIGRWLDQNHKKYPAETLAKLAIKHAIEQAQKPPEVLKKQ